MSSLAVETKPLARDVRVTENELTVFLADGRKITVPLAWFPRLVRATPKQRGAWELLGDGEGIRFPAIDEDLSVAGLLHGMRAADQEKAPVRRSRSRG